MLKLKVIIAALQIEHLWFLYYSRSSGIIILTVVVVNLTVLDLKHLVV